MKIAVAGCCHGALDATYGRIARLERENNYKIDLLLINGDFEALRTEADLKCMAVPNRYLKMGDFNKYYTGEKEASVLTIVIGGNHEASNYLWELAHGGFLAPNIYYLGVAGVVQVNGLRIAGASGIYKKHDYRIGFYEKLPFDQSSMRSIYHIREFTVKKLLNIQSPDVFLSHDWPQWIEQHGDHKALFKEKPHFKESQDKQELGSPALTEILQSIKPSWWFSAHMHCKFEATVSHESGSSSQSGLARTTKFLALDRCLPNMPYMEVVDIGAPQAHSPPKFTFDSEWLGITRAFNPYMSRAKKTKPLPAPHVLGNLIQKSIFWVKANVGEDKEVASVQTFVQTSPGPVPGFQGTNFPQPVAYTNPQTTAYCSMLEMTDLISPLDPSTQG